MISPAAIPPPDSWTDRAKPSPDAVGHVTLTDNEHDVKAARNRVVLVGVLIPDLRQFVKPRAEDQSPRPTTSCITGERSYTISMMRILADSGPIDWVNMVIAAAGSLIAIIALLQTRKSNAAAQEANEISRGANDFAHDANRLATRALEMQEDEGRVRLIVKPRMMCFMGEGEDPRARPVVEVINLSAFPVTIRNIHWKTDRAEGAWFYWKNPSITSPFDGLPARLPPRESLTALGTPTSFKSVEDLQAITAAVVFTSCGEQVEGMTPEWKTEVARLVAEARAATNAA